MRIDEKGRSLIHKAVIDDDLGVIISIGRVESELLNRKDKNQLTPFMLAISLQKKVA